jgi:hypothetical protein
VATERTGDEGKAIVKAQIGEWKIKQDEKRLVARAEEAAALNRILASFGAANRWMNVGGH